MTDTGGFRFSNTTSETYRIAADLIDKGAIPTAIHEAIFDTNSESKLHLLGHALRNKMRVLPDYRTAFISLSQKELKEYHFKKGDTEGFVNYALSIKNIVLAAFFIENEDIIKVSLRSKGTFDVNKLARTHFNGGGHVNASGGNTDESLEDAVKRFVAILPDYYEEISQLPKNA
jgi:phosphoesterase RecJ-like protein